MQHRYYLQPSLVAKGEQDVKRSKPVAGAWGKEFVFPVNFFFLLFIVERSKIRSLSAT